MKPRSPNVTLVTPTRNRRHTIARAVRSVLAQTHGDWELVVVDDASTDDTAEIVRGFGDARIRYVVEREHVGVTAAKNRGLDEARGAFIGILDSDDELVPHALDTLLGALDRVDERLDAISCNCVDAQTGRLTGHGLERDRWLTVPLSLDRARGEHWGIFHRRILGERRFDPNIHGHEGHLWSRIHDGARWYYLHQGLRVYHRDGADRLSRGSDYTLACELFDHDPELLRLYARWSKRAFARTVRVAALEFMRARDRTRFDRATRLLDEAGLRALAAALRAAMAVRSMA